MLHPSCTETLQPKVTILYTLYGRRRVSLVLLRGLRGLRGGFFPFRILTLVSNPALAFTPQRHLRTPQGLPAGTVLILLNAISMVYEEVC